MLGRYITGFEPGFGYWLFALVVAGGPVRRLRAARRDLARLRTEGALQAKAMAWARWGLLWVALGVALVSLATPLVSETVRDKWFDFPRTLCADAAAAGDRSPRGSGCGHSVEKVGHQARSRARSRSTCSPSPASPTACFPYVVIDRLTIWEAAAHPSALTFVLVGDRHRAALHRRLHDLRLPRVPRQGDGGRRTTRRHYL